ncbi:hypothetical protein J4Q44_G00165830 [Coregonus suidteri]|uniref:Uncharacterized protein n=1 Tax=Coregonus suidteri TaxID=861788 RepID=A0AAN8QVS5_9TELE
MQQTDSAYESGDRDGIQRATAPVPSLDKSQGKPSKPVKQQETEPTTEFTVKLRGCPFKRRVCVVLCGWLGWCLVMTTLKPEAIQIIKNATATKPGICMWTCAQRRRWKRL